MVTPAPKKMTMDAYIDMLTERIQELNGERQKGVGQINAHQTELTRLRDVVCRIDGAIQLANEQLAVLQRNGSTPPEPGPDSD